MIEANMEFDGGKTWKKVASGTTATLSGVFFFDEKQGWAVGANGTIRRSQDGGNTWRSHLVDTQVSFYGLSFVSPSEGWVVGGNGTILHTKDGGAHWVDQASKTSAALYAVQFLTPQHGTAVGAVGTVLMTHDGGTTWAPQETQGAVTLFDVYFSDASTGWAVGNAGAIFQMTNGGNQWIDRTLPCSRTCTKLTDLLRVRFTNPENGWIVYTLGVTLLFGLSFLVCGWLILLRRSQDWVGMYLSLLLFSWASGVGVFSSMPNSPLIEGSYVSWFMWPGLFLLLYFFPSGHIVPRWARWFALGWIIFSAFMFITDILGALPENFLFIIPVIFAVLLVGGYAQIFRYRRAAILERQQIKLVVFSLVLFAAFFVCFALAINVTSLVDPSERRLVSAFVYALRLPHEVKDLFYEWAGAHYPLKVARIRAIVRDLRGGRDNDPRFGKRMTGEGPYADLLRRRFHAACSRLGLDDQRAFPLETTDFRPPQAPTPQLQLF